MLESLGWTEPNDNLINAFKSNKKLVVLYPHTSKWDLILALSYFIESPSMKQFKHKLKIIVKDETHYNPMYNPILTKFGSIPAEPGNIDSIYNELDNLDEFLLLISPKGKYQKGEWKSGWYRIAKRYDASVVVAGTDYVDKTLKMIDEPIKIKNRSIKDMENMLKDNMGKVVALYPEEEPLLSNKIPDTSLFETNVKDSYLVIGLVLFIILTINILD